MSSPSFTTTTRVGDIVAAQPLLSRVFESLGIDFCCGGKITLAEACAARGLDPATFVAVLQATPAGDANATVDVTVMSLSTLANHIEQTHHAYLQNELPILVEQADRVATKHEWRDARLPQVAATVRELAEEMFQHMAKEERILFPLIRDLENTGKRAGHCGSIANPIAQMEFEHDSAGDALKRLRELTDGYAPNADACNTHRALLAGLARLETDLHQHVHKENNVLFPRAIALEAQVAA